MGHNFQNRSLEKAYISNIKNLKIGPRVTQLSFEYSMPPQVSKGEVLIWDSLTVDLQTEPLYRKTLDTYEGSAEVVTDDTNFKQNAYVVAISASEDIHTIAATNTILNGQIVFTGSSALFVVSQESTYITVSFVNPPNITAQKQDNWAVIYEGMEIGKGEVKAYASTLLDDTSGLITVEFPKGTLINGHTYNVCLSVGSDIGIITAAYVFQYTLV